MRRSQRGFLAFARAAAGVECARKQSEPGRHHRSHCHTAGTRRNWRGAPGGRGVQGHRREDAALGRGARAGGRPRTLRRAGGDRRRGAHRRGGGDLVCRAALLHHRRCGRNQLPWFAGGAAPGGGDGDGARGAAGRAGRVYPTRISEWEAGPDPGRGGARPDRCADPVPGESCGAPAEGFALAAAACR